ncbi:MAG TPA: stage II sporulation protein D, partial [Ruminococcaceae bacterium]|nr:stage II sporulation protein D [Oscillospiraceae bacterium]
TSHHQGYLTPEARKKKWGDKAESYEKKLTKAVRAVIDRKITYDGEPIIAAFHANNSGITLSAEQVWGGDIPYLKSVKSPGDKLSPDCSQTVALKEKEFKSKTEALDGCKLSEDQTTWVKDIQTDKTGFVRSITVGGVVCTGQEFKQTFGLRSNVFTFEYRNGSFFFTTLGYGHGVGLSQYGADYLARQGKTWEEIITHYYTGVKIEKI